MNPTGTRTKFAFVKLESWLRCILKNDYWVCYNFLLYLIHVDIIKWNAIFSLFCFWCVNNNQTCIIWMLSLIKIPPRFPTQANIVIPVMLIDTKCVKSLIKISLRLCLNIIKWFISWLTVSFFVYFLLILYFPYLWYHLCWQCFLSFN